MQNLENKYFWDHTGNAGEVFKLRRLFEYASFPDLIKIPFDRVKSNINAIDLSKLRTTEKRIKFLMLIQKSAPFCNTWEEAIFRRD